MRHQPGKTILGVLAATSVCTAQNAFVNWESPHVYPLDLTPDGARLLAVNTADNRLEVFRLDDGLPIHEVSIPVGLDPVSVRARNKNEAWVVNHISDSVSIVDLERGVVRATIRTLDEPTDVVFAGVPPRAFICCSQVNTVLVIDPDKVEQPGVPVPLLGEDPRAMATSADGRMVYVAVFESGNGSTVLGGGRRADNLFPRNVVSDPEGPYGGQNPPPNRGTLFDPPIHPDLPAPPRVSHIVRKDAQGRWMDDNNGDWTAFVSGPLAERSNRPIGWDLPDRDLAMIDAQSLSVRYVHRLMNLCMALAVNPVTGRIAVVGTEATNEVRFVQNLQGRFLRVHLALVDADGGAAAIHDLNPHLTYDRPRIDPGLRRLAIGDPRGIAWNREGTRAYVAGKGSNNVVVLNRLGQRMAEPAAVGEGPGGIVLSPDGSRLYVLNHFGASISVLGGLANDALVEEARVPLPYDPTPPAIRTGRKHLYDTHRNSGLGHIACASCHVDARMDRLAWDLGNPADVMSPFDQNCLPGFDHACEDWHPMKGPTTTQTLQDIIGKEPHHWRADKDGLEEFAGAFRDLQGTDDPLPPDDMQEFEDFLATIHFPPNPYRRLDNTLPTDLPLPGHYASGRFADRGGLPAGSPLPNGNAERGLELFRRTRNLSALRCVTCHTLPTGVGTNYVHIGGQNFEPLPPGPDGNLHHAVTSSDGFFNVTMKIPQLRNLYDKVGMEQTRTESLAGFGFLHDGATDSITRFLSEPLFIIPGDQEVADLVAFLLSFSGSDLPLGNKNDRNELPGPLSQDAHAAVGVQVTLNGRALHDAEPRARLTRMLDLAKAKRVGLVAKGAFDDELRGFSFVGHKRFQSDRRAQVVRFRDLLRAAGDGAELTFTAVPFGSETRIGIDRDQDGAFDQDELDAGCNPSDPNSRPEEGCQ